jgi:hypothetical protein
VLKLPRVPGWGSRKVQGPAHALHNRAAYAPSLTLGGAAGVWTRAGAWFGRSAAGTARTQTATERLFAQHWQPPLAFASCGGHEA